MAHSASRQTQAVLNKSITPQVMAKAGVSLALARWYHSVAPALKRFTNWDLDRIQQVHLQVARAPVAG